MLKNNRSAAPKPQQTDTPATKPKRRGRPPSKSHACPPAAATAPKAQPRQRLSVYKDERGEVYRPSDSAYVIMDPERFNEEAEGCEPCEVCGEVEKADELGQDVPMLECSQCLRGYHISCLTPELDEVPQVKVCHQPGCPAQVKCTPFLG